MNTRLRKIIEPIYFWLAAFGVNPLTLMKGIMSLPFVITDYIVLIRQNKNSKHKFKIKFSTPCLTDKFDYNSIDSGHYFLQDLYVARKIFERNPKRHIDVGSRIDGFITHVASFREIESADIRPPRCNIPNVIFNQIDITDKRLIPKKQYDSLSCLHALEHFGLGRYSDRVNIDGYIIGFKNLTEMVKQGGIIYLSVPIGEERIEFNGHRVFDVKTILEMIKPYTYVINFSYIDDIGVFHKNVDVYNIQDNCEYHYGCGIFELIKI